MTAIIGGVEVEPTFQAKPKHPIRDALTWLCGKCVPSYVQGYDYSNLTEEQHMELQEWVIWNIDKTKIPWSTGIGLIDAAEKIVEEAVSNGNIPDKDSKWRTEGTPSAQYEQSKRRSRLKKKKAQRGFTLGEMFICMVMIGGISIAVLYGIFKWVGSSPAANSTSKVEAWARSMNYTYQSSTCQVFGIVSRCTVRVKEQSQPFSLDCNMASEQCSLTPMVRQ